MQTIVHSILHIGFWLLVPPLLPGVINKVKAWVAGRRGPPLFLLYYDLARLLRKHVVMSETASPGFILAPVIGWTALGLATAFIPFGSAGALICFKGDFILFIYLLALARFCTVWAAMETGSAFEGMGSAREVGFAVLAEAALITALLSLCVQSGSLSMEAILSPSAGTGTLLLAAGLFTILLSENCRVPFDDPNTHLELTMIHEVMVLDHSGPPLAIILHGASVKLMLFSVLLVQAVLPVGTQSPAVSTSLLLGGTAVVTLAIGITESLMARFAFNRVPLLLTTAFLLCLFALLAAWRGGVA